ncbi:hypothetical protein BDF19DRAFT_46309 [Syncephalis fuscata]|nr:hypothetical protein BDF19DRAFT_46309 [Syncephalis fuscata]
MAASNYPTIRRVVIAAHDSGDNQLYQSPQLFDNVETAHPTKSSTSRKGLLKPMARLLHKARAATIGKKSSAYANHTGDNRPSVTTLFDTTPPILSCTSELARSPEDRDNVVVSPILDTSTSSICNDTAANVTADLRCCTEQVVVNPIPIESDSSASSIHSLDILSSPTSLSAIPSPNDTVSPRGPTFELPDSAIIDIDQIDAIEPVLNDAIAPEADRCSVHSAHTVAVCTHYPYAEGRRVMPTWQQSEQQLPLSASNDLLADGEPVSNAECDRRGHRSLGRRAWHGLRQQIARALPHLSRPRFGTGHFDEHESAEFRLTRGRSRTMPPVATMPDTDVVVRRRRHISDLVDPAMSSALLQPPPYMQGALYSFAWAPNRASVTVSVTVSTHATPCGSGYATPNPTHQATAAAAAIASSPAAATPCGSTSNLHTSLDQSMQHSMPRNSLALSDIAVVEMTPGVMAVDGRTFPLPPASLQPRMPFRHPPVAAPARRPPVITMTTATATAAATSAASLIGSVVLTGQRQRNRARSASASTPSSMPIPIATTIRANYHRNSSGNERALIGNTANTTAPSSPTICGTNKNQSGLMLDAHERIEALLCFGQALGHAILELQDSAVLWEQPTVIRTLARRPEMYAHTRWPESVHSQLLSSEEARTDSSSSTFSNGNIGGAGGDFAPGALIANQSSSHRPVSFHGSTNSDDSGLRAKEYGLLLPSIVRQLVIQADQALLRAHTMKAKALLKQAVDPLSNRIALAKAVVTADMDSNEEANTALPTL